MAMQQMSKKRAVEIVDQIVKARRLYGAHAKVPYSLSDVTAALALLHEEGSIALTPEQEDLTKAHRQYAALNARFAKLQKAYDDLKGWKEQTESATEALAIRLLGKEAFENSPVQAHPLELVEVEFERLKGASA